jgi:hypothetical protein
MKTIHIEKFHDPLARNKRERLNVAALALSKRPGYSVISTDVGFQIEGPWAGKFETEEKFVHRIARDLQLRAEVIFDYVIG